MNITNDIKEKYPIGSVWKLKFKIYSHTDKFELRFNFDRFLIIKEYTDFSIIASNKYITVEIADEEMLEYFLEETFEFWDTVG